MHSASANAVVRTLLQERLIPELLPYTAVRQEVKFGQVGYKRQFAACTLVNNGTALFQSLMCLCFTLACPSVEHAASLHHGDIHLFLPCGSGWSRACKAVTMSYELLKGGASRVDFVLDTPDGSETYVEVKSVTLAEPLLAQPDLVTAAAAEAHASVAGSLEGPQIALFPRHCQHQGAAACAGADGCGGSGQAGSGECFE